MGFLKSFLILTSLFCHFVLFHGVLLLDPLCLPSPPRQGKLSPVCLGKTWILPFRLLDPARSLSSLLGDLKLTFFLRNLGVHTGKLEGGSGPCHFSNSLPLLLVQGLRGGVCSPYGLSRCSLVSPVNWEKVERIKGRNMGF